MPEPFKPFSNDAAVSWTTDTFTLDPDTERYVCFAATLAEDLVVNGYANKREPLIHHLIFARVIGTEREPETLTACDTSYRSNWETVYVSGAGENQLEFPADAGHKLAKGSQLVVQMHLINSTDTVRAGALTIQMRRSQVANPRPVNPFLLGTTAIDLPPRARTAVTGTCSMWQGVKLIGGFPHMHSRGRSLRIEVGPSENALTEVYRRDPFHYAEQRIDSFELVLSPGDMTRVTCTFENAQDQKINFGETSDGEMCFFFGFAVDLPAASSCLDLLPHG
jgi:hypothetical protein